MGETPLAGISVLLLEEKPDSEGLSWLRGLGASVAHTADATMALQLLEAAPGPNVVVCDLQWSGIDDWAFWARLQKLMEDGRTPVIGLTPEGPSLHEVSDAGFQAILVKPVSWVTLGNTVLSVAARYRHRRQLALDDSK